MRNKLLHDQGKTNFTANNDEVSANTTPMYIKMRVKPLVIRVTMTKMIKIIGD